MLSERSMTFSQLLEELGVSSSHLTYHLENLGELVTKTENGKYKLSTFGAASVETMKMWKKHRQFGQGMVSLCL
jgi:predicted transcriptional regulator